MGLYNIVVYFIDSRPGSSKLQAMKYTTLRWIQDPKPFSLNPPTKLANTPEEALVVPKLRGVPSSNTNPKRSMYVSAWRFMGRKKWSYRSANIGKSYRYSTENSADKQPMNLQVVYALAPNRPKIFAYQKRLWKRLKTSSAIFFA